MCKSVCESEQNKAESYLIPHRFESDECFVIQSQLDLEERERERELKLVCVRERKEEGNEWESRGNEQVNLNYRIQENIHMYTYIKSIPHHPPSSFPGSVPCHFLTAFPAVSSLSSHCDWERRRESNSAPHGKLAASHCIALWVGGGEIIFDSKLNQTQGRGREKRPYLS